ncbi:Serine/threonine-protein kinase PrkC [Gemmata obscuriglobus]
MPAPTTADEMLELVRKSNLVDEAKLRNHVQKLRDAGGLPADPTKLAQLLVRDGVLTYFQAEQLLQGKYKRFNLGKYKVLEKLGSGGMGTVFLCEHKLMRRRVAVKVLPLPRAEDRASLDRFYREAKAAAAVDHPNVVRAYDIDQDDNLHFLVMEWVDGVNLQDLVKKFGPLDITRACHYIYGAAVGLQHAHEMGLIHRDVKPGNILVDRSGVVKLLDLGLARLTHDTEDNLTRQNDENVLGTADYLAPEQAMDSHTVDIRADIYSLGATFYYLLGGTPPFPEGSVAQKLIWHQTRVPRAIKALRAELPNELVAVIEKMMAKDPARRYQIPAEVTAALAEWVATPIPPPAEREMPVLSPAVIGSGRGSGPPSLVSGTATATGHARPHTLSTAATVVTAGATPPPAAAGTPAVWANLDTGDKDKGAARPEALPLPPEDEEERPSRVRTRTPPPSRRGGGGVVKAVVLLVAAVLVVAAAGAGAYFAFFAGKTASTAPSPPPPTSRRVIVSKGGGENAVGSLREAIAKVGPGDTIVITEPRLSEPTIRLDKHKHKDVTIESGLPDGRLAVIEPLAKGGLMFDTGGAEGLRLRNLEFDGKGQAEIGVQLSGNAPGTLLDNVTVRNVVKTGVHLWNVAGDRDRPVVLDRLRVALPATGETGLLSLATGGLDNKFVTVRNCRFEGPGRSGVLFDGPAIDFEVSNCRFYHLTAAGVSLARPGGRPMRCTFTNNTFYQMPIGFHFDGPANELGTGHTYKIALNYFAKTDELLKAPAAVPGLAAANNLCDPSCGPGTALAATKIEAPRLPDPNPNDDAAFLRFPVNPPTAEGSRVGAN